jgi:hypothetical protein
MSNELAIHDTSQLSDEGETQIDFSANKCTAEALAAIADLDDESRIEKRMRVTAAIAAKEVLPDGKRDIAAEITAQSHRPNTTTRVA